MPEEIRPTFVLLDLMLPVMSGPQMLKKLRGFLGNGIPVIIISNLGQERSDIDLEKYKISAYMVKALYTQRDSARGPRKALKKGALSGIVRLLPLKEQVKSK